MRLRRWRGYWIPGRDDLADRVGPPPSLGPHFPAGRADAADPATVKTEEEKTHPVEFPGTADLDGFKSCRPPGEAHGHPPTHREHSGGDYQSKSRQTTVPNIQANQP